MTDASSASGTTVTSAAFREALAHFASGVTVVAARSPGGPVGFTATGFTSVSLSPPIVLVSVGKEASAYSGILAAERFGVSILAETQEAIARRFATSGIDRFEGVELEPGDHPGVPLISGALARLDCRRHARHDAGDHTLLLGEVVRAWVSPGRPLLHFDRHFGAFLAGASTHGGPAGAASG
jgi:flavin reductase (DIM6/NTAB) family NADH-FMN oxidoreductase RutF